MYSLNFSAKLSALIGFSCALCFPTLSGDGWQLIEDFENGLDAWTFIDTDNQTDPHVENPQINKVVTDTGNSYLKRQAAPDGVGGNRKAIAHNDLPFVVELGDIATFYMRFAADAFPNNHNFGLGGPSAAYIEENNYNAFEATIRVTDKHESSRKNDGTLQVMDDGKLTNITDPDTSEKPKPMVTGRWNEIWLVVDNRPKAEGGQTYDAYLRDGVDFPEQTLVYEGAGFRRAREDALTHFMALANSGRSNEGRSFFGTGAILWDDLYIHKGKNLTVPVKVKTGSASVEYSSKGLKLNFSAP